MSQVKVTTEYTTFFICHRNNVSAFFCAPFLRIRLEFTCNLGISIQETVHFINYKDILQFEYCWDVRLLSIVTQHIFVIKEDYSKDSN